jgi:hypothetical protein
MRQRVVGSLVLVVALLGLVGCEATIQSGSDSGTAMPGIDSGTTMPGIDSGTTMPGADSGPVEPGACPLTPPLDAPIAGCDPPVLPSTGDPAEDCVRRINQLRCECQHLPPLMRWRDGEACADQMAEYDSSMPGRPHAGFADGICAGGRGQNECPGWGSVEQTIDGCLQAMWDEGPGEPFSEHGHYINMTNPAHTMVACGFAEGGRGVYAVQNFR